jgi:uncharacterized protein YbbC (DUF1343 family)
MLLGSEQLLASSRLKGLRVGILANPSSVDHDFRHIVDRLGAASDFELAAIFGPQHGFRSDLQDNMIETPHTTDPAHGVPVFSLYSETREPTKEMLDLIDVLIIDLQDVGARIYTFIYTMANCLRAAAKTGTPVIVCDRPNPIGGVQVEGPMLEPGYESFVGQFPIPMRLYFDDIEIPWVMPSPNMPTLETAIVYPGTVLFEGTMVSEGRGTTRPFELIGAPWLDGAKLTERLRGLNLGGVHFREVVFEPTFQKHAKTPCGGCQLHLQSRWDFEPVKVGTALLREIYGLAPDQFQWRDPPYEYEHDKMPIDILAGSTQLREQIEAQVPLAEIADSWRAGVKGFEELREPYLLY